MHATEIATTTPIAAAAAAAAVFLPLLMERCFASASSNIEWEEQQTHLPAIQTALESGCGHEW
jgi:hypothetical protein